MLVCLQMAPPLVGNGLPRNLSVGLNNTTIHNYFWGVAELNFRTQTYFLVWNGCSKLKNKFELVFWMRINMIYPHINDNIATKYINILVCYAKIEFQHTNALI